MMANNKRIDTKLFPENTEIFSWIKDLGQWGHRKTGTPEGRKSAEYIEGKMKEFGLEDVYIEKSPSMCMFVDEYSLEIEGNKIDSFFINGTNRGDESGTFTTNGEFEFIYLGEGSKEDFDCADVEGKIVVCSINLLDYNPLGVCDWFENYVLYDPEDKMQTRRKKTDIYSPCNWPENYFKAIKHGAKGFVGILENYMDDPFFYNEDYTEIGQAQGLQYMNIPGMWVSRSTGKELKTLFEEKGTLKGNFNMTSRYETKDALNVRGVLKGMSDELILVHSHHDAVSMGSVQDASGISEMLALAKYFSQIPKEERKKSMMFAATDTHYTDYMGHRGFIERRHKEGDNIILDVAIEHVGKEVEFDDDYNLIETGQPESRLVYVSANDEVYNATIENFKKYDLDKSILARVPVGKGIGVEEYEFRQDEVISDAYYFNEDGIPVVSMVCGEQYIFHKSDTPDRIPQEQLGPVGMAFAEIVYDAFDLM